MNLLLVLIIAVSLSMDAFSLSLAYGTIGLEKNKIISLTTTVALFHFFMPLLGLFLGSFIIKTFSINTSFLTFIVLVFIGIQMIIESIKGNDEKEVNISNIIFFAFAVSIDSFMVGIGLSSISDLYMLSCLTFSLCSGFFTYIGLILGNYVNLLLGKIAPILGGVVLIILGISYL